MLNKFDRYMDKIRGIIDDHGWAVQGVFAREDHPEEGPGFAYTVGFTEMDHPEFIIFSLPMDTAQALLNALGERVRVGEKFQGGDRLDWLVPHYVVQLLDVVDSEEHLTVANRMYEEKRPVPALQIVWPDKGGRMPWEAEYSLDITLQPLLGVGPVQVTA